MNTVAMRHFAAPARKHTEHGAVVCTDYHPPRMQENARAITCRGIVIGGAIAPPVPTITQDGERIQAALLEPRTAHPLSLINRIAGAAWRWC
mgnify:CR=1 FL=1